MTPQGQNDIWETYYPPIHSRSHSTATEYTIELAKAGEQY